MLYSLLLLLIIIITKCLKSVAASLTSEYKHPRHIYHSDCVRWQKRKKPFCWWRDEDLEMDRFTAGAQSDYHWQTQAFKVKFATALLMQTYGSSSTMVSRATFNSSVVLGFGRVYGTFPVWCPRCNSPAGTGTNLESLGATNSSQWSRDSLLAASSARRSNAEKWGLSWLKWHKCCNLQSVVYIIIHLLNLSTTLWMIKHLAAERTSAFI